MIFRILTSSTGSQVHAIIPGLLCVCVSPPPSKTGFLWVALAVVARTRSTRRAGKSRRSTCQGFSQLGFPDDSNEAAPFPMASWPCFRDSDPAIWCQTSVSPYDTPDSAAFMLPKPLHYGKHITKFSCQPEMQPCPCLESSCCMLDPGEGLPRGSHLAQ